ncbi:unnamed protein product [Durusdinium trenchii]|uniref:Tr-type G domain-containing protein n=1 Tax=Durusdinium trenchii TaxID=1381693 RepID=A0ABP0P9X4_9DINO
MEAKRLTVALCGHVDSGKTSLAGTLLYMLGRKDLVPCLATPEEHLRGITITCKRHEFFTDKWNYTLVDCSGHRDFIKNMLMGASQAEAAILLVPADGSFTSSVQPSSREYIEGGTRQHGRLLRLLGIQQMCVVVNKMDCDLFYGSGRAREERFNEIRSEVKRLLAKVGWPKGVVETSIPILPLCSHTGDNVIAASSNMAWWPGQELQIGQETIHVKTLYDVLNQVFRPKQSSQAELQPLRMSISNVYCTPRDRTKIVAGRVEQGCLQAGEEIRLLPEDGDESEATVDSIQMFSQARDSATEGDLVGLKLAGLGRKPRSGDVVVAKDDMSFRNVIRFDAQVMVRKREIKTGYCPLAMVRCARAPCRLCSIRWKMSKQTGDQKIDAPSELVFGDLALCTFDAWQSFGPL